MTENTYLNVIINSDNGEEFAELVKLAAEAQTRRKSADSEELKINSRTRKFSDVGLG